MRAHIKTEITKQIEQKVFWMILTNFHMYTWKIVHTYLWSYVRREYVEAAWLFVGK